MECLFLKKRPDEAPESARLPPAKPSQAAGEYSLDRNAPSP